VKGTLRFRLSAIVAAVTAVAVMGSPHAAPARPYRGATVMPALERSVLSRINTFRVSSGRRPLHLSPRLGAAARSHSLEMAAEGYFDHASADGTPLWRRIASFYGEGSYEYWAVGENLLWAPGTVSAAVTLRQWEESPQHLANLLSPQWRVIGVSAVHATAAPGVYDGQDVTIVTVDFGVRR